MSMNPRGHSVGDGAPPLVVEDAARDQQQAVKRCIEVEGEIQLLTRCKQAGLCHLNPSLQRTYCPQCQQADVRHGAKAIEAKISILQKELEEIRKTLKPAA